MNLGGKAIIFVGMTGAGKSALVKRLIRNVHTSRLQAYDVNAEYFENESLPDIKEFMLAMDAARESVIIFEEATVFFSNRGSDFLMRKLLVGKRHNRNTIFLLFHSIRSIPYYIYDLCNYVVVFNTNDSDDLVKDKHELLFPAFRRVRERAQKIKSGIDKTKFWLNYEIVKL